MKLKLLFLGIIVSLWGCARKTYNSVDYQYYKTAIEKAKQKGQTVQADTDTAPKAISPNQLSEESRRKYADLLEIPPSEITNDKLYKTIDQWLGTPYLWGGETKKGIDCSAFVREVYNEVYEAPLPRTSIEQFYANTNAHFRNQDYLQEGDLIFFRLRHQDKVVSHVGIYLQNGKFLGANSPRGVEIADLKDNYWQDKYVASSRLLDQ